MQMKIPLVAMNIFLFECLIVFAGYSQKEAITDSLSASQVSALPPLSVLIDSAISTNAMVRFRNLDITSKEYNIKAQNSSWIKNFGIQADARYGTFDNFSTNTAEGQTPSILATRNTQMNYGVGAFVKFPFFDFVNRKNQLKMARIELSQAESMAEAQKLEVKQMVIRQFNDVLLKQRLLEIKSRNLGTARVNLAMVEKQFQNRSIDIAEYARITEIAGGAEAAYESARAEYITAYMILEEMAGFKFR
jgi:outer membrane protein TolC